MRIASFEVQEPIPRLKSPHAIAILRPWVDCGSVGTMALQRLESLFVSRELAYLARPGSFYDFTRYRPIIGYNDGVRHLTIPNTMINWARNETGNDLVFLHLLEPNMFGEVYAESVYQVLKTLDIRRYCLLGSFYDMVPHTRPILISGSCSDKSLQNRLYKLGVQQSNYQGPTSICNLIAQEAEKAGVETLTLMVHLPHYIELEEDYLGLKALLQVLKELYDFPMKESDNRLAEDQMSNIGAVVQSDPKLKAVVAELEVQYDARTALTENGIEPHLSSEVDQFLKEMENRFQNN